MPWSGGSSRGGAETVHGPHPKDPTLFSEDALGAIREAAVDLRYLLDRGYARPGVLKLVGDRFQLTSRQRQLLFRGVCAPRDAAVVRAARVDPAAIRGAVLLVDGHNVLITLETALAGGVLIRSDDGFLRDIAEKHGAYRRSEHTTEAIGLVRDGLEALRPARVACYLDRPLPFSGLLAQQVRENLGEAVTVDVVPSADGAVKAQAGDGIVATSDSAVLLAVPRSFDLAGYLVERAVPDAWIVSLA
jgi:hypothetical protein